MNIITKYFRILSLFALFSLSAEECSGTFLRADFLMLRACEDQLDYGFKVSQTVNEDQQPQTNQKNLSMDFDWDPGFRLATGYISPSDCKAQLCWTHFNSKAKGSASVPANAGQMIVIYNDILSDLPGLNFEYDEADARLKLHVDWVDLAFSKKFYPTNNFWIEPQLGARGLYMDQKIRIDGDDSFDPTTLVSYNSRYSSPTWAYGLQLALHSGYQFDCGLTFAGYIGGAILYSDIKVHQSVNFTTITDDVTSQLTLLNTRKIKTGNPMLDLGVEINYLANLFGYQLQLFAGWEQHVLFDIYQGPSRGTLSLSGVNLGAVLNF